MSNRKVRAGQAEIELNVKSRVAAGMRKAGADMKRHGRGIAKIGASVMAAGGAIAAPLAGAVKHFAAVGDKLHKMSIRTRASTEALSELGFAGEQSGTSLETIGATMFRVNRRLANATQGTGPAVRALKALNLEAETLSKMGGGEQLEALADGFQSIENEGLRLQYAFEILGDGAKALWPMIENGSGPMRELRNEARELGLSVSTMDATQAADFGDALNRVTRIGKAMTFEIGAAVAPAVTGLLRKFADVANGARAWVADNRELFASIAKVAAGVTILGAAITTAGFVMIGLGAALTGAAAAFSFLLSPIGLATIGIVGFGVAVFKYTDFAGKAVAWLADRFSPLMDAIGHTGEILFDALARGEWADAFQAATNLAELAWLDLTSGMRETWDAVADVMTNTSTMIAMKIGKAFQALGESLGDIFRWIGNAWAETMTGMFSVMERFGKMLSENAPDNMLGDVMKKAGNAIGLGGFLGGAGVRELVKTDFGGLGNKADDIGGKIAEFGRLMQQEAEQRGRDKIEGRQDARNERQARRDELRQQIRQGAEGARERNRERKDQLAKLLKMPQLPELGQFDGGGGMGSKSGPGNRGAFSSAALAFLGTTAATPEKRTADGVARLVDIQQQMLDNQQQGVVPVFGD